MSSHALLIEERPRTGSRQRLLFVIALLVTIIASIPAVLGVLAESLVRKQVSDLNGHSPINVEISYYRRGWLTSRMLSRISIPALGISGNFSHSITHGPARLSRGPAPVSLLLADIYTRPVLANVNSNNGSSLALATNINFSGAVTSHLSQSSTTPQALSRDNTVIDIGRLNGRSVWNSDSTHGSAWANLEQLVLSGANYRAEIENAYVRSDTLGVGSTRNLQLHINASGVHFSQHSASAQVGDVWLQMRGDVKGGAVVTQFSGATDALVLNGERFENASFDATLRIPRDSQLFERQQFPDRGESSNTFLQQMSPLMHWIPDGSRLEISRLETTYRQKKIRAWVRVDKREHFVNRNSNTTQSEFDGLTIDAEVEMDQSLVFELLEERTREVINRRGEFGEMALFTDIEAAPLVKNSVQSQLDVLERQGYLRRLGGQYAMRLSLLDGHVSINDKPLILRRFMR